MTKNILGVVAGVAVWIAVVSVAGLILRLMWPAYAEVADAMSFSLPMLVARLSIGALATLAAGLTTATLARGSMTPRLITGAVLLVAFIPVHVGLWDKFPVWYHLTFLLSLVPLTYAGGTITVRRVAPAAVPH
jgi:hypothetical protein